MKELRMTPNIYWVGGGRGGVGKSVVSMALLDYLLGKGVPTLFVESDTSHPDVYKAYRCAPLRASRSRPG